MTVAKLKSVELVMEKCNEKCDGVGIAKTWKGTQRAPREELEGLRSVQEQSGYYECQRRPQSASTPQPSCREPTIASGAQWYLNLKKGSGPAGDEKRHACFLWSNGHLYRPRKRNQFHEKVVVKERLGSLNVSKCT